MLHILWKQSHHNFSYDQQYVSDIAHFVKGSLITSFPITNSLWATLHILWKVASSHLCLQLTGSEWHCTFSERQSHHIFSYDQQQVSDTVHFVKAASLCFWWPTVCEWHCTFCERQSHHIFFLRPTVCEWHSTFCKRQSHHFFSYNQQAVSMTALYMKGSLIISFPMTNSKWVTLHILGRQSSHIFNFPWPKACEWQSLTCILSIPQFMNVWCVYQKVSMLPYVFIVFLLNYYVSS